MNDQSEPTAPRSGAGEGERSGAWAAIVSGALFVAATAPAIALNFNRGPGFGDQFMYHLVAVRRFMAQWPRPDWSNYEAASTPGYHLILAAAGVWISPETWFLRALGSVFTLALVCLMAWWTARRTGTLTGVLLSLPLIASTFLYTRAIHINSDNTGWLCVLAVLLLALRGRQDRVFLIGGAVLLVLTVLFRQIHIWTAGLLWAAAWLGPAGSPSSQPRTLPELFEDPAPRIGRTLLAIGASVPALLALAYFYRLWGSLVPPMMATVEGFKSVGYEFHTQPVLGMNFTIPAVTLTLTGVYGLFYLGFHTDALRRLLRADRGAVTTVLAGAAIGFLAAAIPATNESLERGRTGDIWTVVRTLPVVADRSLFLLACSTVGGAVLGVFWLSLDRRSAWMMLAAYAGLMLSQMAQFNPWQRYVEPGVLIYLGVFTALALARPAPEPRAQPRAAGRAVRLGAAGIASLTLLLSAVTVAKFRPPLPDYMRGLDALERDFSAN